MRLLFDQNLSHNLPRLLADLYPDSAHVRDFGLHRADDETIWALARDRQFAIVSKDDDFHQRSFLYGPPPKVVWLRLGNCSTAQIVACLRKHAPALSAFEAEAQAAFLALS